MTKLDKDAVIQAFTEAYEKAHGKKPEIEAKSGWFSVDGGKNMRLAQLQELADELAGGTAPAKASAPKKAEKKADAPAKKAPAAKKAAAPKKAPVAKKSAPVSSFTVSKQGDGLRPADHWIKYLAAMEALNRLPRGID